MNKLSAAISGISDGATKTAVLNILRGIYARMSCKQLVSAGLVITATAGKKVPKTGASTSYGLVQGKMYSIAAGVDMPALVGTVTNAKFNVYCFFANKGGGSLTAADMTCSMGTEGATIDAVKFPAMPENKSMIGFIIINPTGTGNFVGGTTALDDATVVPNTVYVSPTGAFDPTALV